MMKIVFKLTRAAKSQGGDRYEAVIQGLDKPMVIYIPQFMSRKDTKPRAEITVDFSI
jgi:hypothetical protein